MNELEAKRIERAIRRLADEVTPLAEAEIARMARETAGAGPQRRPSWRLRLSSPRSAHRTARHRRAFAAALAGAAFGTALVPMLATQEEQGARTQASLSGIVDVPAGSALDRLLADVRKDGRS